MPNTLLVTAGQLKLRNGAARRSDRSRPVPAIKKAAERGTAAMSHVRVLHPQAGLRHGAEPGPGAARRRLLQPADGARVSQRRRAGGVGLDQLSRRLGHHHREPDHAGAGRLASPASPASTCWNRPAAPRSAASPCASCPNVDPDVAASDVRDRVSRVRRRLPDEVDEPTIAKVEADAQAIMYLVFTSDRMNALEITDYVDRFVARPAQEPQRRRRRDDLRRAPLCHAHLDRPRAAGRLQSHGAGHRERAAARRTSSCRPGASRAATASSRCCRAPAWSRPSSSATSSSRSPTAIR